MLIALVALLLIVLGLLGYFLLSKDDEKTPDTEVVQSSQEKKAEVETDKTGSDTQEAANTPQDLLNSVRESLPEGAEVIVTYNEDGLHRMYYTLEGQLIKYDADNDVSETVRITGAGTSEKVASVDVDVEDDYMLYITTADSNNKPRGMYTLNIMEGKVEPLNNNPVSPPGLRDAPPAPMNPPTNNVRRNEPPRRSMSPDRDDEWQEPPRRPERPKRDWRRDERPNEERYQRDEGGTGFHFESTNQPSNSGSGTGIKFQKVDRIPNQ